MNKKGITPIIAVVLLLMMTVAAAGAAFYWLTRMQQQAQAGVTGAQQQLIEEASASIALVSQAYPSGSYNLSVDAQNTGGRTISMAPGDIIMVLENTDGNSVCASGPLHGTVGNFVCSTTNGCNATPLSPQGVRRLLIEINETTCSLSSGLTYYYQLRFQRGATISGSFRH